MMKSHDTAAGTSWGESIIRFKSVINIRTFIQVDSWTINGRESKYNFLITNIGGFNITGGTGPASNCRDEP